MKIILKLPANLNGMFYSAGSVVDVDDETGLQLIKTEAALSVLKIDEQPAKTKRAAIGKSKRKIN